MASGCPVAAATSGSLPEICGDAAVLFDPEDPHAIADGILAALDRKALLVPQGVLRSAQFTWEVCASEHRRAFRRAQAVW
jgi:glycosyltransferase involved in cell wall biosynthesis